MIDTELYEKAKETLLILRASSLKVATAESCTGGMIGAALTAVSGSSDVVERGFITYSNEAKSELLDVSPEIIAHVGAVSEEVAKAMALGAVANSLADCAVAVTGVAGPGQSEQKPAGLVYIAFAHAGQTICQQHNFLGDRTAVRRATVLASLDLIIDLIEVARA